MGGRLDGLRASALVAAIAFSGMSAAVAGTLDNVKARGFLDCGVNESLLGFAQRDASGNWVGFDVDFCRAVAAAIFDDPTKVSFVPLSTDGRFPALKGGQVDILSRNASWTMGREADYGFTFVGVTYYDGQGFLLRRAAGINSALELGGKTVCVQGNTTTAANLADYFIVNNMTFATVTTASVDDNFKNYAGGKCDVVTGDMSQLYAGRLGLADADEHVILPDAISKEPLGPAVRAGDPQWALLVKWVYFALLDAEELGVGSTTIDEALLSKKPDVRRLVGNEGFFGSKLGLESSWATNFLRTIGNYGQIYERNLGTGSKLGIPRGMNQLWSLGGIQYAPPIR
jgi:general L-amino acid transport system substrate-binding protein